MPKLMPTDIVEEVEEILNNAARGKGPDHWFLTAYQILNRLRRPTRDRLILERKRGGKGGGVYFGAASVVAKAVLMIKKRKPQRVDIGYLDTRGLIISDSKSRHPVVPSFQLCGIYRAV